MKTRTLHAARCHGQPAAWTCEDAEAARLQANQTARPWGVHGLTPAQAWRQRRPIGDAERCAFLKTLQRLEREVRQSQGYQPSSCLTEPVRAAIDREAISRALVAHSYLVFTCTSR